MARVGGPIARRSTHVRVRTRTLRCSRRARSVLGAWVAKSGSGPFGILFVSLALACGSPVGPVAPAVVRSDAGSADGDVYPLPHWDAALAPTCEETCVALHGCESAVCVDGACVRGHLRDGTECAAEVTSVCVSGECRERGCGDGWRERGDAEHAREGCDDSGTTAFCDATCLPTIGTLATGVIVEPRDLAVAVDGQGRALIVLVERLGTEAVVRALRYDALLRADGPPIELVRIPQPLARVSPAAAGLSGGGWAVAILSYLGGVDVTVVPPEGMASPFVAWIDGIVQPGEPSVAALSSGFVVIAAALDGTAESPLGGVRARIFESSGHARGAPIDVALEPTVFASEAVVAASGDAWRAAWMARADPAGPFEIRTRAFSVRSPVGPIRIVSRPGNWGFGASLATVEPDHFGMAWLESDGTTSVVRSGAFDLAGTLDESAAVSSDGLLFAPQVLTFGGGAFGVVYVEENASGPLRAANVVAAPLELSRLLAVEPAGVRWARASGGVLAVWLDVASAELRGFRLAPRAFE